MALALGKLSSSVLAAGLSVLLVSPALADGAGPGSFRAAQDKGLSLELDPEFLDNLETTKSAKTAGEIEAAAKEAEARAMAEKEGSSLPDQDAEEAEADKDKNRRVDLSDKVSDSWKMNPVLLNRSQGGEPSRPEDDLRDQTIGLELRREF
ncbi:MAG: hypothetical protein QNJ30_23175 [Kiloniellales bacterium]|nr:hypothetical protein [Kiloniellales bacterium]